MRILCQISFRVREHVNSPEIVLSNGIASDVFWLIEARHSISNQNANTLKPLRKLMWNRVCRNKNRGVLLLLVAHWTSMTNGWGPASLSKSLKRQANWKRQRWTVTLDNQQGHFGNPQRNPSSFERNQWPTPNLEGDGRTSDESPPLKTFTRRNCSALSFRETNVHNNNNNNNHNNTAAFLKQTLKTHCNRDVGLSKLLYT